MATKIINNILMEKLWSPLLGSRANLRKFYRSSQSLGTEEKGSKMSQKALPKTDSSLNSYQMETFIEE
jgi:hypothetical protein